VGSRRHLIARRGRLPTVTEIYESHTLATDERHSDFLTISGGCYTRRRSDADGRDHAPVLIERSHAPGVTEPAVEQQRQRLQRFGAAIRSLPGCRV
jgi:hypothetical protein